MKLLLFTDSQNDYNYDKLEVYVDDNYNIFARAYNQCGYDCTEINITDIVKKIKECGWEVYYEN